MLLRVGVLLFSLWEVYICLLRYTEDKTPPPLFVALYRTVLTAVFVPALVMLCLDGETPLLLRTFSAFAVVCGLYVVARGWVKYFKERE